jgi:hypothetical protein
VLKSYQVHGKQVFGVSGLCLVCCVHCVLCSGELEEWLTVAVVVQRRGLYPLNDHPVSVIMHRVHSRACE